MGKIQNTDNTKCLWGCGAIGTLIHCWWECKMVQPLWKRVWQFLTKLNILLPYDPAIMFFSVYPKELKTYVYTKTCTQIFIEAWFIIAKTWKQPRCPSVGEWIGKLWYVQTMEYYSMLKRNELSSHENTWGNLQCILSRKRRQGLPWWRSSWESACQCRGHGFEPWSGKIPHAVEQLGPWATTTEPVRLEPVLCNKRARDSEEARAPRWRVAPACRNWRKPSHRNEDPTQPKIKI